MLNLLLGVLIFVCLCVSQEIFLKRLRKFQSENRWREDILPVFWVRRNPHLWFVSRRDKQLFQQQLSSALRAQTEIAKREMAPSYGGRFCFPTSRTSRLPFYSGSNIRRH